MWYNWLLNTQISCLSQEDIIIFYQILFTLWHCLSINLRSSLYHLDSLTRAFTASTCNSRWWSQRRFTLKEQSEYGIFCPGWKKWHRMLCPGWQKQHGMFCPGWQIFVGCFVRGVKKWHGMFCPGMFCSAPVFWSSADFWGWFFFKEKIFRSTIRVSNSLDLDQARYFVWPDLGPNCYQLTACVATSKVRVKQPRNKCL